MDTKLQSLTTELASTAPFAPPMPRLDERPRRSMAGAGVAVGAFAAIVLVAVLSLASWSLVADRSSDVASADVYTAMGASPVAIVADDGSALRGYLWSGSANGVLMVPAYGQGSDELLPMATSAHAEGATVLLLDPRGQGASEGDRRVDLLVADLHAAIADLQTRGVETATVVGIRHTATAAIVMATEPPETVEHVVAFFPFEQYQGLDAISVVAEASVPLTIVGASQPSDLGPWAGHLITAAPDGTTGLLLPPLPSDAVFMNHYREAMVEIVRDLAN
ncbi:MAG: alpha/beta hydrolase [Acidimicrobiia bacterium]